MKKPNFDFERRERGKAKAAKKADKRAEKAAAKATKDQSDIDGGAPKPAPSAD